MRWASRGQKTPSFRAVLPIATEPQRLPKTPKSVSDRLLSLFTRTPPEKVRVKKTSDFRGFLLNPTGPFGANLARRLRAENLWWACLSAAGCHLKFSAIKWRVNVSMVMIASWGCGFIVRYFKGDAHD
jgi:hypothetical protein